MFSLKNILSFQPQTTPEQIKEIRKSASVRGLLIVNDLFPELLREGLEARKVLREAKSYLRFNFPQEDISAMGNAEIISRSRELQALKAEEAKKKVTGEVVVK